jgi:hypothetical protein
MDNLDDFFIREKISNSFEAEEITQEITQAGDIRNVFYVFGSFKINQHSQMFDGDKLIPRGSEPEIWGQIPNYSKYEVSTHGNVRRIGTFNNIKYCLRNGYHHIKITSDKGDSKDWDIHKLVVLVFVPNPENKKIVDHRDDNRGNTHLSNLQRVTSKENAIKHVERKKLKQQTGVQKETKAKHNCPNCNCL